MVVVAVALVVAILVIGFVNERLNRRLYGGDNLTLFSKFLINIGLTLLAAFAVMLFSPVVLAVPLSYWEALGLTTVARLLPTFW